MKTIIAKAKSARTKLEASRKLQIITITTTLIIIFFIAVMILLHSSRFINTDDAYINANIVQITPQVSGQVIKLDIQNNQFVKAGTILFEVDPAPYNVALEKAKAQLNIALATWQNAQVNTKRILELVKSKTLTLQDRDDATKNLQVAIANYQLAKAALNQATLDLRNTKVYATVDGFITNLTLRPGNVVNAFQPLFALISNDQYWADANFKETELQNIHSCETAEITVDMYPSHVFQGIVESISGGSGTAFSLLPPQNATGNWVKITQRVPVKVRIINPDPKFPLRIGVTANVTIDSKSSSAKSCISANNS